MGATSFVFHLALFSLYGYVSYFLHVSNKNNPANKDHPVLEVLGRFSGRFLTNWTFTVQMVYFAISLVGHTLGLLRASRLRQKVDNVSDYIFMSVATPMAFVVSLVFWGLYSVDRELVYPKELDLVIPVWVNQVIHTINAMSAIVDLMIVNHKMPSWKSSAYGVSAYLAAYGVCLYGTYFQSGIWIYPIFKVLPWPQKIAFTAGSLGLALLTMSITRFLHTMVWGSASSSGGDKKKKQVKSKKK